MTQEINRDDERTHYSYAVGLRIEHPQIDPSEITANLGILPKRAFRVGEPRTGPKGSPLPGLNKSSYWVAEVCEGDFREAELALVLDKLLDSYTPFKEFFRSIRRTGGQIEIFVGWFFDHNSGDVFSFSLLQKFADLQIDLSLDIYEPTREP